jgi:hypothetical protein
MAASVSSTYCLVAASIAAHGIGDVADHVLIRVSRRYNERPVRISRAHGIDAVPGRGIDLSNEDGNSTDEPVHILTVWLRRRGSPRDRQTE